MECHRYASSLFSKIFEVVKYKYVLGLTATFERLDGKEAIIAKYCPVVDKISTEEALFNGWISQYKEYAVLIDVDDINVYNDYNKEFYEHFEFFHHDFALAMSCVGPNGLNGRLRLRDKLCPKGTKEQKSEVLKSIIIHATGFTRAMQARKKFINNHPKKIEIARKIIEARNDKKIITFSNNVKMAESIGMGYVYTGKISKKKGRATLEEFSEMPAPALINSCQKLNEGADLKGLSVAIHLGIDSSKTKAIQKRGRVIRMEKDKVAENFILVIRGTAEESWLKNAYGTDIIKLNEEELDKILAGEEITPTRKSLTNLYFRW
jgi:superfamily II DNA or RNA helicase